MLRVPELRLDWRTIGPHFARSITHALPRPPKTPQRALPIISPIRNILRVGVMSAPAGT